MNRKQKESGCKINTSDAFAKEANWDSAEESRQARFLFWSCSSLFSLLSSTTSISVLWDTPELSFSSLLSEPETDNCSERLAFSSSSNSSLLLSPSTSLRLASTSVSSSKTLGFLLYSDNSACNLNSLSFDSCSKLRKWSSSVNKSREDCLRWVLWKDWGWTWLVLTEQAKSPMSDLFTLEWECASGFFWFAMSELASGCFFNWALAFDFSPAKFFTIWEPHEEADLSFEELVITLGFWHFGGWFWSPNLEALALVSGGFSSLIFVDCLRKKNWRWEEFINERDGNEESSNFEMYEKGGSSFALYCRTAEGFGVLKIWNLNVGAFGLGPCEAFGEGNGRFLCRGSHISDSKLVLICLFIGFKTATYRKTYK